MLDLKEDIFYQLPETLWISTKMILWFEEAKAIAQEKKGPICKTTQRQTKLAGYQTSYWFLQAEDYGAALVQE
jgi:hypothetical protein